MNRYVELLEGREHRWRRGLYVCFAATCDGVPLHIEILSADWKRLLRNCDYDSEAAHRAIERLAETSAQSRNAGQDQFVTVIRLPVTAGNGRMSGNIADDAAKQDLVFQPARPFGGGENSHGPDY